MLLQDDSFSNSLSHTHTHAFTQGAAAERRFGMTAGDVVDVENVEEGGEEEEEVGERVVVALRDAAGAVPVSVCLCVCVY